MDTENNITNELFNSPIVNGLLIILIAILTLAIIFLLFKFLFVFIKDKIQSHDTLYFKKDVYNGQSIIILTVNILQPKRKKIIFNRFYVGKRFGQSNELVITEFMGEKLIKKAFPNEFQYVFKYDIYKEDIPANYYNKYEDKRNYGNQINNKGDGNNQIASDFGHTEIIDYRKYNQIIKDIGNSVNISNIHKNMMLHTIELIENEKLTKEDSNDSINIFKKYKDEISGVIGILNILSNFIK
ncbi:hypothetical protein [Breznakia pachnodae]|uniref:Membrane protein n=1 Tax=Breznakia pachnodae TaxID=265178 RepID=A0ABU0E461_9FIRM|nr:hypothetical protein [Breznakia pachnodae]MDQ0361519.1 putative membrane protein [Breznakia pachnodae]